jgi:hypothetical protein
MSWVSSVWGWIQGSLFPFLEEDLGPLTEWEKELVKVVELLEIPKFMSGYRWKGNGCPPKDRTAIIIAFLAKAIWNQPTTRALVEYLRGAKRLRRLCGWELETDIPSESTFSRAFAAFARDGLPEKIHEELIRTGRFLGLPCADSAGVRLSGTRGQIARGGDKLPMPEAIDLA